MRPLRSGRPPGILSARMWGNRSVVLGVLFGWMASGLAAPATNDPARARVIVVNDPAATSTFMAHPEVVRQMVERGLKAFSGKPTTAAAWKLYVQPTDVVGFKVTSAPGPLIGTRGSVVEALVRTLIDSGHPPARIVIWDRRLSDLYNAGFGGLAERLGVRLAGAVESGWDPDKSYESPISGRLIYGDFEFGEDLLSLERRPGPRPGRRSFVSRLVTRELTKIISVAPVLNHNLAGVNGHVFGLSLGSTDNVLRFEIDPVVLSENLPDLFAMDDIQSRLLFGVSDALIAQTRGEQTTRLHDTAPLNELRFSLDLVALDSLAWLDVNRIRGEFPVDGEKPVKTDLYRNTALMESGVADTNRIDLVRVP
jgi:hypothetical protein